MQSGLKRTAAASAPPPVWVRLLLGYLLLTLPVVLVGLVATGGTPRALLTLLLHLPLVAWTVFLHRAYPTGRGVLPALADWTLLGLLPLLYWELPVLMEAMPGAVTYRDPAVQALEAALFGGRPAWEWASALPYGWLSELLHLGYLSYYPLIYLPPALLWLGATGRGDAGPGRGRERRGRDTEAFHRTVLALGAAMLGAYVVMIAWPVQGPRYLGVPEGVPAGPFRSVVLSILEGGSSRGAAFPSSHVSVALAQTLVALRFQTRVGLVLVPVTLLLAAGAVYGGFHYAVDVLAGALLGVGAAAVALAGAGRNPTSPAGLQRSPSGTSRRNDLNALPNP